MDRRRSETGMQTGQPYTQVVGFHVEGASPSPGGPYAGASVLAGSPTPVIIPPNFQRDVSLNRAPQGAAPQQQDSNQRNAEPAPTAQEAGTAPTSPMHGGAVAASSSAIMQQSQPQQQPQPVVPTSAPRPIHNSNRAEAAHAGLQRLESQQGSMISDSPLSSTMSGGLFSIDQTVRATPPSHSHASHSNASTPTHTAPHPSASGTAQPSAHAPQAAAHATGPSQPAGKAHSTAGAVPNKPLTEMTKEERRALHESQGRVPKPKVAKAAVAAPERQLKNAAIAVSDSGAGQGKSGGKQQAGDAKGGSKDKPRSGGGDASSSAPRGADTNNPSTSTTTPSSGTAAAPPAKRKDPKVVSLNSTELFAHLQQYKMTTVSSLLGLPAARTIHPSIVQLGLRYAEGSICGANARCLAMLNAFCQVIRDYVTPEGKELSRDLLRTLNDIIHFLVACRPLSVTMGNAIRQLKLEITSIEPGTPDAEAKKELIEEVEQYVVGRIEKAAREVADNAVEKIESGDTILTYAASFCVQSTLITAHMSGKRFKVVVADSRPEFEGRATLHKLMSAGIPCTYVHLNACSYIIKEVSKVFLGAAAVLSNGAVLGRTGSASIAMIAHAHSVPVLICAETHKFNERVQLDSITHNELGDPGALGSVPGKPQINDLQGWSDNPRLRLLNLKYDVMPAEFVTMVVTELGPVPPTSVPVVLREQRDAAELTRQQKKERKAAERAMTAEKAARAGRA